MSERRQVWSGTAVTVAVAAVAVALAGCSATTSAGPGTSDVVVPSSVSSTPGVATTPPPMTIACPARARTVLAAAAGAPVHVRVSERRGFSRCSYVTSRAATDRCRSATVTIDTAPQAYVDFHRWVDESEQNSTIPGAHGLAPVLVHAPELTPEVDWVPGRQLLAYGEPGRWVSVAMSCPGPAAAIRPLARALADTTA